jgi:hypothetical protein
VFRTVRQWTWLSAMSIEYTLSHAISHKIHFNIILYSAPKYAKWYLSLICPDENYVHFSFPIRVLNISPISSWFNHTNNIRWGDKSFSCFRIYLVPLS